MIGTPLAFGGRVTQRLECHLHTVEVGGSIPPAPTASNSKLSSKLVPRHFAIAENPGQQAAPDCLVAVHGHDGASTVGMAEEMVAAPDPNGFEAECAQCRDQPLARDRGQAAQVETVTLRTSTKSSRAGSLAASSR